jgi:hypothetical protein
LINIILNSVAVPVPVPTLEKFWFRFRLQFRIQTKFSTIFQQKNIWAKACLFNVRISIFPKKLASKFYFLTVLFHFILDPDTNPVPEPEPDP